MSATGHKRPKGLQLPGKSFFWFRNHFGGFKKCIMGECGESCHWEFPVSYRTWDLGGHAGLTISHPEEGTICDQTISRHLGGTLTKSPRLGYKPGGAPL